MYTGDFQANSRICAMDNFTPLHFSAQQSNSADVIALLAHNEKSIINARTSKGGKTALHLAAAKGNPEILGALIEVGADVKMKTSTGLTAADITKNEDCFKLLRAHMNSTSATRPLKAAVGGSEVGGEAISSSGNTSSHEDSSSVLLSLLSTDDTLLKPVTLTAEIVSGTSVAFKRSLGSLESQAENDFESAPSESKRPCVESSAAAIIDSTNDIVNNDDPLTMSL